MAEGQDGLLAVAAEDDPVALRALSLLREAGAPTATLATGETSRNGHIVFTGKDVPGRFPNAYLRVLGNTVHVRENAVKEKRNPNGFKTAVLEMGVRLSLLPKPPAEKRARRRNRSRYWRRQRERTGLRI